MVGEADGKILCIESLQQSAQKGEILIDENEHDVEEVVLMSDEQLATPSEMTNQGSCSILKDQVEDVNASSDEAKQTKSELAPPRPTALPSSSKRKKQRHIMNEESKEIN